MKKVSQLWRNDLTNEYGDAKTVVAGAHLAVDFTGRQ